jgi:hypothetical protein
MFDSVPFTAGRANVLDVGHVERREADTSKHIASVKRTAVTQRDGDGMSSSHQLSTRNAARVVKHQTTLWKLPRSRR